MASTSYLTRVIYRENSSSSSSLAGTWKLLVAAKTIPSPVQPPNPVESTTLEDSVQTFENGIKTSGALEVTGNLEKSYLDAIDALADSKLDFLFLYGTDGFGAVAKYSFSGKAVVTPSDVGGVDEILGMTVTITPSTVPEKVTDTITVTTGSTAGEFTVATV